MPVKNKQTNKKPSTIKGFTNKRGFHITKGLAFLMFVVVAFAVSVGLFVLQDVVLGDGFRWTSIQTRNASIKVCQYTNSSDVRRFRLKIVSSNTRTEYINLRVTRGTSQGAYEYPRIGRDKFNRVLERRDESRSPAIRFIFVVKNANSANTEEHSIRRSNIVDCQQGGDLDDDFKRLRVCESGPPDGNYQSISPNRLYYGAYQFSIPTWNSRHTGVDRADHAPRAVQDRAARSLQADAGWGQWPDCARALNLI